MGGGMGGGYNPRPMESQAAAGSCHVHLDQVRSDEPRLGPVTLRIARGEFVAVVGPPGSGGAALVRVMAGLAVPAAGAVRIGERAGSGPQPRIGCVFAHPALMEWRTAGRNVLLGAELRRLPRESARTEARRLLARFGLAEAEARHPAELGAAGPSRVALCRALLLAPEVLVLDD